MLTKDLLVVVDRLYEAALLPAAWPQALEELAAACGATGATISRGAIPEPALASPNLEASTREYAAQWWRHDDRARRVAARFQGYPLTEADIVKPDERRRDPFYQEFLKGYGLETFAAVLLDPLPGMRLGLMVERGAKPFTKRELEALSILSRHVSRALAATARLGLTEAFANDHAVAAEHTPYGMIFLDRESKVRYANASAQRLLGDGLVVKDGVLLAAAPGSQAELDRLIARIRPGSPDPDGMAFLGRQSGKGPLALLGVPLRPIQDRILDRLGIASGGVLLLVYDLAAGGMPSVARALQQMGLTPAQARIAEAVGKGSSLRAAAELVGVVESTARTQLKAAYARLGLGRQSELAILVTKLAAMATTTDQAAASGGPELANS